MSDYLKQIRIENFKSHEKTILNLAPGINVIYGDPQAGKSNIIKALRLLFDNRPIGGKFLPNFLTKGETNISISDKNTEIGIKCLCHRTKKGKKKRDSTYYYIKNLIDESIWDSTGVGSNIPAEISKAINISEINLQLQKDPPFLATKSGSKISKTINQITGLDLGDKIITYLNKKATGQSAFVKALNDEKTNLKLKKNFSKEIKDLYAQSKRLEKLNIQIEKNTKLVNKLETKLDDCKRLRSSIIEIPDFAADFEKIILLNNKIETCLNNVKSIQNMVDRIRKLSRVSTEIDDFRPDLEKINVLTDLIKTSNQKIIVCEYAVKKKKDYKKIKKAFYKSVEDYLLLIKTVKLCPTCFSTIDQKILSNIEKEVKDGG